MSAPTFLRPPGQTSDVTSPDEVRDLARWILSADRERPVVVLTARAGESAPYFAPAAVQRLVALEGDVVTIAQRPKGRLTRDLARALPDGLMVFGGAARIYWPTSLVGTDPDRHPLIRADSGTASGAERRARLTNRWREGTADLPPAAATTPVPASTAAPDELPVAITRAWLALLPDDGDRARFPLRPYRVDPDLAAQLAVLEPARRPVAAAAARILTGYAWTETSPVPQRVERDGAPVLRDGDRAVAWTYPLAGGDRPLSYWQPAAGPITLARIGAHDVPEPGPAREPAAPDVAPAGAARAGAAAATPAPRRGLRIADEDLLRVLRAADQPLTAPEIRAALQIDPGVSRHAVSAALADATDRGIVLRTGQTRGTRYAAP